MPTVATPERMTAEEYEALPDAGGVERALIDGILHEWPDPEMTRRNRFHSRTMIRIGHFLEAWADARPEPRGAVYGGEVGIWLSRNPDKSVGADVAYLSADLAARQPDTTTMIEGAPTLVVEILSPSNSQEQIEAKLDSYLAVRVPLVWIANPRRRTVTVYRPDAEPELFNARQELTAEPHLPGFRVAVALLFG